jgi:hypothetical protein
VSRSGFAACSSAEQVTRSLSDQRLSPTSANPSRSFLLMKAGKQLVRRLVEEGVNVQSTAILNEVADGAFAELARRWISPFRGSFPDFQMQIVNLIEEDDTVVAHFRCSRHTPRRMARPPAHRTTLREHRRDLHLPHRARKTRRRPRSRRQPRPSTTTRHRALGSHGKTAGVAERTAR